MLLDPIKACCVHQLGDAFEEDPFAAIDELENLDEEEGKDGDHQSELSALQAWGEPRECL